VLQEASVWLEFEVEGRSEEEGEKEEEEEEEEEENSEGVDAAFFFRLSRYSC
ncbi:hypothetical protein CHS0354_004761, partial [Potamilus streckersoni]